MTNGDWYDALIAFTLGILLMVGIFWGTDDETD